MKSFELLFFFNKKKKKSFASLCTCRSELIGFLFIRVSLYCFADRNLQTNTNLQTAGILS